MSRKNDPPIKKPIADPDWPEISLSQQEESLKPERGRIALDTLARYSGSEPEEFQPYILLTNFPHYVEKFADHWNATICRGAVLKVAHCKAEQISLIDYRVGAPMAALVIDVLSYIEPQCVVMLGLCGGLHRYHKVGDFILPIAAIRDEGASRHYMPPQVPSLPAFLVQQFISQELMAQSIQFETGVVHTTDYRMWEFDQAFNQQLRQEKATAIDMESSALFSVAFSRKVPIGALHLISDLPTQEGGIKTKKLAQDVFARYTDLHLKLGVAALKRMQEATQKGALNFRRFAF